MSKNLSEKIAACKTVSDCNNLREVVAKEINTTKNNKALIAWRRKYRLLKECPTCGRTNP